MSLLQAVECSSMQRYHDCAMRVFTASTPQNERVECLKQPSLHRCEHESDDNHSSAPAQPLGAQTHGEQTSTSHSSVPSKTSSHDSNDSNRQSVADYAEYLRALTTCLQTNSARYVLLFVLIPPPLKMLKKSYGKSHQYRAHINASNQPEEQTQNAFQTRPLSMESWKVRQHKKHRKQRVRRCRSRGRVRCPSVCAASRDLGRTALESLGTHAFIRPPLTLSSPTPPPLYRTLYMAFLLFF